jgi:amino-acid N-acetyltransferase
VHIPCCVSNDKDKLDGIMEDLSILHLLGVQLVLVACVREQVDRCAIKANVGLDQLYRIGVRITDEHSLQCLKEAAGATRSIIECSLSRGFRGRPGQSGINAISGNFFYSARPVGVRNGIDFK